MKLVKPFQTYKPTYIHTYSNAKVVYRGAAVPKNRKGERADLERKIKEISEISLGLQRLLCSSGHLTSHFLQGTKNTRSCITGDPVVTSGKCQVEIVYSLRYHPTQLRKVLL